MNTNKNLGNKKQTEWEWCKSKFGKFAYIIFPLIHLIGFAIIIGLIYLIIQIFK